MGITSPVGIAACHLTVEEDRVRGPACRRCTSRVRFANPDPRINPYCIYLSLSVVAGHGLPCCCVPTHSYCYASESRGAYFSAMPTFSGAICLSGFSTRLPAGVCVRFLGGLSNFPDW